MRLPREGVTMMRVLPNQRFCRLSLACDAAALAADYAGDVCRKCEREAARRERAKSAGLRGAKTKAATTAARGQG